MRNALTTVTLSGMIVFVALGLSPTRAQTPIPNPAQQQVDSGQTTVPVFRITVVGHSTAAINYRYRSGETPVDFQGTPLLPRAKGHAKVETKRGFSDIDARFAQLEPATKFGPEYLTYVMWAITPDGRATNLGEVLLNGEDSKLHVTTDLQAFALIVTAEPYFAVTQPSDVVVLENQVRPDTKGAVEAVEAKYELLKRGSYVMNSSLARLAPRATDSSLPLELREARNAVALAGLAGADRYAAETFQKASQSLDQAEGYQRRDAGKPVIMMARAATQTAEDARLIAIERQIEQQTAAANDAATQRELQMLANARAESERARKAEAERAAADEARARAEEAAGRLAAEKAAAEQTAAQRDEEKAHAEAQRAEAERARANAERAKGDAERAKSEAERATQQLAQEKAQADAARQASEADAARARSIAEQAEHDKAALRARLREQLNIILETRESARGLIVNMSDVLFDSGQATLRPGAREKLAKVAGILLAYPGLTLEVEGHTDSIGAADFNQGLSERRADVVRSFLIRQGIRTGSIVARGYGKTQPVATNGTAAGRQQNRRVELIVSGEPIG
jgi:outer membrane protein OmpA-like peptidoglycan-associated protein